MAHHKHGEMDIRVQEKTFGGFVGWIKWAVIAIIGVLILMALVNS